MTPPGQPDVPRHDDPAPARVALVTGASRGIGRAVALRLAALGHTVAVNFHSAQLEAEAVVAAIGAAGGRAAAFGADVSSRDAVVEMFKAVESVLGPVEVLVNNAGINRDGLLLRMSQNDWDTVIDVDLRGAFFCTQAALRGMVRRRWGRVVNMSSVVGLTGNAGQANYAAAKAGLIGFTRATAREVASRGITVNAVAPGFIETDMTAALTPAQRAAALVQIPGERFGAPEDVAAAVAFLVSGEAAYITGQVLTVDGGMVMA
jgi:3-oxoacyl-[acyl-carrier protein] reductase